MSETFVWVKGQSTVDENRNTYQQNMIITGAKVWALRVLLLKDDVKSYCFEKFWDSDPSCLTLYFEAWISYSGFQ